jgi:hypothetical protein
MSSTFSREQVLQQPGVHNMIAERAYYISEKAGFSTGRDMDFWLQAETELLSELQPEAPASETANGTVKKTTRKTAAKSTSEAAPKTRKPRATKAVAADGATKPAPRKRAAKTAE